MNNNIDIILNTTNTLILQEEDVVYFIAKGGLSNNDVSIIKVGGTWYEPTLEELDDQLRELLANEGLFDEEIEDKIEEFHQTEFYNQAKEYLKEDESEEE